MLGNFSCFYCRLLTFFKNNFLKKIFQDHYQSVKWLDEDQDRDFVGPDLGPNCLQRVMSSRAATFTKFGKRLHEFQ